MKMTTYCPWDRTEILYRNGIKKRILFFYEKFKQTKNIISKKTILSRKNNILIRLSDLNK